MLVLDHGLGPIKLDQTGLEQWTLIEPFAYQSIVVPAGFVTDGASSPLRDLIKSWGGHYNTAALVHDYLYDCLNRGHPDPAAPTRAAADGFLYEIMQRCGVNFWVRWAMWLAVRGFGGPGMRGIGVRTNG